MCIFTAHLGEYLIEHLGEFLYWPSICVLNPIQVNREISYWPPMCNFTAHPFESLTVHRWISYWPSICAFTAHPSENLTTHLGEFLIHLPCLFLQPIQVNILLHIWVNCLLSFHVYFYSPSSWFFTAFPSVLLQPIKAHILLHIWVNFLLFIHVFFYSLSRWISYCSMPIRTNFLRHNVHKAHHPGEHLDARSDDYLAARTGYISAHLMNDLMCIQVIISLITHSGISFCTSRWIYLTAHPGEYFASYFGVFNFAIPTAQIYSKKKLAILHCISP